MDEGGGARKEMNKRDSEKAHSLGGMDHSFQVIVQMTE